MVSDTLAYSTLQSYLNNKLNIDLCEFHTQRSTCSPYPASWADPRILSKTESHQITRKGQLPKEIHKIIHANPQTPCRVFFDMKANIAVISTMNGITIFNYKSKDQYFSTALFYSDKDEKIVPYFDIYVDNDSVSYISVTARGRVKFSQNCFKTSSSDCQIELAPKEHVTVVKLIHGKQAFIGTSTGDCYILYSDQDNKFAIVELNEKLYGNTSVFRYFMQDYQVDMLTKSLNNYPLATSEIIDITAFTTHYYISNKTTLSIWSFDNNERLVCLYYRYLLDDVINRATRHIDKEDIKCEIVAIKFLPDEEFVVLASYTVPEMKGHIQYLVIRFYPVNTNEDLSISVKYSTTLPYTTHPSLITRPPRLTITPDLAFVSFDQSVVIVSLTRKSVYEEYIALNDPKDEVLFVKTEEDTTKRTNTALIFTANSGVLEVNVDIENIQSVKDENVYAGLIYEIKDQSTMTFKLRLEQAVFFGTPESLPLRFPFESVQVDVAGAVIETAKEIFDGTCIFMPPKTDFELYMESSDELETTDKGELMSLTERSFIALNSYKEFIKRLKTSSDLHKVADIIHKITGENLVDDMDQLRNYFLYKTTTLKDLLHRIVDTKDIDDWEDIIIDIVDASYNFEMESMEIYDLEKDEFTSMSDWFSSLLITVFDHTLKRISMAAHASSHKDTEYESLQKRLKRVTTLILNIEKCGSLAENNYNETSKYITEKLRSSGLQDLAIVLAHERHDTASIILCLYQSQAPNIKEQNNSYIGTYGIKYFNPLLDFLIEKDQTTYVFELGTLFPEYMLQYFESHAHPRISWVYFLQQKDYPRAIHALSRWLQSDISDTQRKEISGWLDIVTAAATENRQITLN